MMADVANHQGGLPMSWSRVSGGGANCVEQAVTNYQGFPARAGYRSRSGHTAVRELVYHV